MDRHRARELIGKREYRYLSPSFLFHPLTRQIVRLKGVGLVHNPNLHLTALASEEATMPTKTKPEDRQPADLPVLAKLATALGLPAEADAAAVLTAVFAALMPGKVALPATAGEAVNPARYVPIDAVRELLADRNANLATMRESDAVQRVDAALRTGHITPAMKGWAKALCMQDTASFDTFISKSPAPYAHLHRQLIVGQPPGHDTKDATASEDEAIWRHRSRRRHRLFPIPFQTAFNGALKRLFLANIGACTYLETHPSSQRTASFGLSCLTVSN